MLAFSCCAFSRFCLSFSFCAILILPAAAIFFFIWFISRFFAVICAFAFSFCLVMFLTLPANVYISCMYCIFSASDFLNRVLRLALLIMAFLSCSSKARFSPLDKFLFFCNLFLRFAISLFAFSFCLVMFITLPANVFISRMYCSFSDSDFDNRSLMLALFFMAFLSCSSKARFSPLDKFLFFCNLFLRFAISLFAFSFCLVMFITLPANVFISRMYCSFSDSDFDNRSLMLALFFMAFLSCSSKARFSPLDKFLLLFNLFLRLSISAFAFSFCLVMFLTLPANVFISRMYCSFSDSDFDNRSLMLALFFMAFLSCSSKARFSPLDKFLLLFNLFLRLSISAFAFPCLILSLSMFLFLVFTVVFILPNCSRITFIFFKFVFLFSFKLLTSFFNAFRSLGVSLESPSSFSNFFILFSRFFKISVVFLSALLSPRLTSFLFSSPDTYLFLNVVLTFDGTFLYVAFTIIVLNSTPRSFFFSSICLLILASPFRMLYDCIFCRASSLSEFKGLRLTKSFTTESSFDPRFSSRDLSFMIEFLIGVEPVALYCSRSSLAFA